ncbi:hypothetical protein SSX86_032705, partial [Deinandra increscens subsp. villosa]
DLGMIFCQYGTASKVIAATMENNPKY